MIKDFFAQVQHVSAQSDKDAAERDVEDDDNDEDGECDLHSEPDESVSRQLKHLVAASQQLLEGDSQKQVSRRLPC